MCAGVFTKQVQSHPLPAKKIAEYNGQFHSNLYQLAFVK